MTDPLDVPIVVPLTVSGDPSGGVTVGIGDDALNRDWEPSAPTSSLTTRIDPWPVIVSTSHGNAAVLPSRPWKTSSAI